MKHKDLLTFQIIELSEISKKEIDNHAPVIAFEPCKGYQWAKYHNGSDTWVSVITGKTIKVTSYLKLIKQEENDPLI